MAIENFLTYTEVDDNHKLTVTASKAEAADADCDEDVYLYKDKTEDYFDALGIDFEIYAASTSLEESKGGMAISNTVGTIYQLASTDLAAIYLQYIPIGYSICLIRGNFLVLDSYLCNRDTLYYCTLERTAGNDSASLKIYSDAERTDLLDTLAVAGYSTIKWRYVYGFINQNYGSGGRDFDGYVQNLDLKEIVEKTSSDAGSGVDAKASGNPLATYARAETGSGVESLGDRIFGAVESGLAAETSLILASLLSVETGSGLDALIELVKLTELFSSDAGSGIDALTALNIALTQSDTGTGLDTALLLAALLSSDHALTTEVAAILLKALRAADHGIGVDRLRAKIETPTKGGDMRLPPSGQASIPSREVNI